MNNKTNKEINELINYLDSTESIRILKELAKDKSNAKRIIEFIEANDDKVSVDGITKQVFNSLNSLDVENVWDNSGETRYGYFHSGDVAHEMVKDNLADFIFELEKYEKFNKIEIAEKYCIGIIKGLIKYDNESTSDFKDYLDGVEIYIDDIYYDLEKKASKINIDMVKKIIQEYEEEIEKEISYED